MRPLNISLKTCLDYYHQKDPIFGDNNNSQWYGKGCKNFNLDGNIKRLNFLKLLQGNSPLNKSQIIKINKGRENRVCVDIPMSAPKSVSIMAIYAQDNKLLKAHKKSVEQTLTYLEKNYIYIRKTKNKKTEIMKENNAIFATFNHSTNRVNDPHLHTHVLIMNIIKTKEGYRSLFNDRIFSDQRLITTVYQSYLKKHVKTLGYKIKDKVNGWDIDGIDEKYIDIFSKRSLSIKQEKELNKSLNLKINNYKNDKISFLKTRKDKTLDITQKQLLNYWEKQADLNKIICEVGKSKNKSDKPLNIKQFTLKEKIRLITAIIHENEASFDNKKILTLMMKNFDMNIIEAEQLLKKSIKKGSIIHIKDKIRNSIVTPIFSTSKMIETEQDIIEAFKKGKNKVNIQYKMTKDLEEKFNWLTIEQKKAVNHVLSSKDSFSIIQGDAGTGKTACMLAVKNVVDKQVKEVEQYIQSPDYTHSKKLRDIIKKYSVKGMGFTGKSAIELEEGAKLKSETIHSFLTKKYNLKKECRNIDVNYKDIRKYIQPLWIVDESSMVGSLQMNKIITKAIEEDSKVIFVGDSKQLQAIGAGKMFSELQKMDTIKTIKMENVLRQKTVHMQKTVGFLKDYMDHNNKQSLNAAFNILDSKKCITNTNNITDSIVKDFLNEFEKNNTLILCGDNNTKNTINKRIRDKLKESQKIGKEDSSFLCKNPYTVSSLNKFYAHYYKVGTKAFISNKNYSGKEVSLKKINVEKNILQFEDNNRVKINIDPFDLIDKDLNISLFEEQNKLFSNGEKIVFRKNDKMLNIQNGLTGTITKIKNNKLSILTEKNKTVTVSEKNYAYLDYGYALTTHKAQGQTCDKILYAVKDEHAFINKTENLYVAATRAKEDIKIYTNNYNKIKTHFLNKQEKTTTLDFGKGIDL